MYTVALFTNARITSCCTLIVESESCYARRDVSGSSEEGHAHFGVELELPSDAGTLDAQFSLAGLTESTSQQRSQRQSPNGTLSDEIHSRPPNGCIERQSH